MFELETVVVDGRRLRLAVGPQHGPPLLFLHGVTRDWTDFVLLFPATAIRRQIFALDFRGHGGSQRASADRYRVVDYVDDVVTLIRDHLRRPTAVYGHSLGAIVAVGAAAAAPEFVSAVVLEDPPSYSLLKNLHRTPFHTFFEAQRRWAGSTESVEAIARGLAEVQLPTADSRRTVRLGDLRDGASLRFSARCLKNLDPAVLGPVVEKLWLDEFDYDAAFRAVRCPSLLLCGDPVGGGMLDRPAADRMEHDLGNCVRVDFPGVGHLIHWMATEKTLRSVAAFLESLEADAPPR